MSRLRGRPLLSLGIECTAHTFGVSIANEDGEIMSDVKDVYKPPLGRGIHPRESAQHHSQVGVRVLKEALREAKVTLKDIDLIAFSAGPGLGPCLRTGATIARALAALLNKPLVRVNHAIGHIEIARLTTGAEDPLVVLVSGGHTTITTFVDGRYRVFGETLDITLGNLLDTFAREAGLPSPGGPLIEKLARNGSRVIRLPYIVKGNDVSYSGLLTASLEKLKEGTKLEDLCLSIQEYAFSMLAEATERALAFTGKPALLLTGGVAANERLKEVMKAVAEEHGATFHVVPPQYSGDCGAQIAWTGLLHFKHGDTTNIDESFVKPMWRLDEVDVHWRQ
ncbi:MAG: KEOPS complex N(6)-L-threonylcarbamoyladenine synthase Kae1 [Candidatus Nezhaarchaeota archaeon]|nr:KEOPS complex N(6)-L-threonylcarbamoyladenine synthase Kae1 [Candidatus Nezhaarchaeota archaeon]